MEWCRGVGVEIYFVGVVTLWHTAMKMFLCDLFLFLFLGF